MASLPRLPRREFSAPPRPSRTSRTAPDLRSRSQDVKNRLPSVANAKEKDSQGAKDTPRAESKESKPKPPPSKLRPHPAFQVVEAADEQLEVAMRARPATTPEAQHGLLLLQFFGISAQEVLSTYNVQISEAPGGKVPTSEKPECRQGSKSSTPRTPREAKGPLVKRSGSMVSTSSERSEVDDGWATAVCWAVPRRNEITGPTCSAVLAAALPSGAKSANARVCRLQYKSYDWVKWGLAVRKDPAAWLGQVSMPMLLGLEKPVVMCSVERSGPEGCSYKLILHWSIKADSNRFLLRVGSLLWQYRWRWHLLSDWTLGSIKKTSAVEWGNYISAPLLGEWSAVTSGNLEISLRYTANCSSLEVSSLNIAAGDWSEWSESTSVVLGMAPPDPGDQKIQVSLDVHDPCRASVTWHSFTAAPSLRLEYRVQLSAEPWATVAWREAAAELQQDFTESLDGLMPNRSYVVRVQGRYAGGDGAGGGWSAELAETFRTLKAWCDEGTQLAAPELVLEPADWASQKGVATQVTRRFVRLPDDPDVELEWAVPGQRWEKLSFTPANGVASFDVMKLQYRLGKNMDALIRWTSHGKAGEITWISTGMEVPCLSRAELRDSGAVELCFDPVSGAEVASCFQIRCEDANGETVDFPPMAILGKREEIKFLVGPTKLSQLAGRSFRLRLRGTDLSSWSPWSPILTATANSAPAGPRPNSLRAGPVTTMGCELDGFEEMVAATSQGTTMKLSWEGFAVSDSHPIGYHLKLEQPKVSHSTVPEVFYDAAGCTISTHLGLQQCELVLRQLMPNTEYTVTLRADGRTDDKAYLSTSFRTGDWTSPSLSPLVPPQLAKDGSFGRNISFRKSHIVLDPRMSLKGRQDLHIYQLQWRPVGLSEWRPASFQLSEDLESEVSADWDMASDFQSLGGPVPNRVQLRMVLQDPLAKVRLPERLWFSEALLMTCGFQQPAVVAAQLIWSEQLLVELPLPSWTQEQLAEQHVTRCQVRFQDGEVFCSEVVPVAALSHVDRKSSVTLLLPLISLPFVGNRHYAASLRLGDDYIWSEWSEWGGSMATTLPKIWSKDQLMAATKPVNCKVKLDWSQLCCDLGPIPVECVVTMEAEGCEPVQIAMTSCIAAAIGRPTLRDRLEVAINGFEPGMTYHFVLHARAHLPLGQLSDAETLSKMDFREVARSETFQWPVRFSEEWSCMVNWSLPLPRQVLIPDDGELEDSSRRWQGRAVLLAWPNLEGLQLEVREESQHTHQVFGWQSCTAVHIRLSGTDYMAACDLPSDLVRFRWSQGAAPGPCSDVCVAKVVTPQLSAEPSPGPSVRLKATVPRDAEVSMISFVRIRFKEPEGPWKILMPRTLGSSKVNNFTIELGEEFGLETDRSYIFSMQFLAQKRRSQWSAESSAVHIQAAELPVSLMDTAQLLVTARGTTAVTISWPQLEPAAAEFRLDVHQILEDEVPQHRTSILVEADGPTVPCEAKVFNLWPATEYSAELFLRCVRAGIRRWHPTGLKSHFITPAAEQ